MAYDYTSGLRVRWSKRENDWMIYQPNGPDGHLMGDFLGGHLSFDEFVKELDGRGYDTTTLRFTVKRRPVQGGDKDGPSNP